MADKACKVNGEETVLIICHLVAPIPNVPLGFPFDLLYVNLVILEFLTGVFQHHLNIFFTVSLN